MPRARETSYVWDGSAEAKCRWQTPGGVSLAPLNLSSGPKHHTWRRWNDNAVSIAGWQLNNGTRRGGWLPLLRKRSVAILKGRDHRMRLASGNHGLEGDRLLELRTKEILLDQRKVVELLQRAVPQRLRPLFARKHDQLDSIAHWS